MARPILAHIHLRKCGGTAFAQLLERHFGPRHVGLYADDVYLAYSAVEIEEVLRKTPDLAAFSTHHLRTFPRTILGRPVLYVTFLRDPVRQFVSHMTHCRKHYAEFTPSLVASLPPDAPRLSLREFARWLLAQEREVLFGENYDVDFFTRYNPGPGCRLSRAKAILNDFFFVGVTERMDQSVRKLRRLAEAQGLEFPGEPLRMVNSSSEPDDDLSWIHPGDEAGAMLLDSICEDRQLYEWAAARSGPSSEARHPIRELVETIVREAIPGELRAAGADAADAAITLRTIAASCGAQGREGHRPIALLWLAGDAGALGRWYPRVSSGGYVVVDQYRGDARVRAVVDEYRLKWDLREPLAAIGSAGIYWRVSQAAQWAEPQRLGAPDEPPLTELLGVYEARPDLQEGFPEAAGGELKGLIEWAWHTTRGDFTDSAAERLKPHAAWYEMNCVDGPWPLLDALCAGSANPLPQALRAQRFEPHVMLAALLVIEFGLREIVASRVDGSAWKCALEEAARAVGGRVHDLGEPELPASIELLLLNGLATYSTIAADLRKAAANLREGSWVAVPQAVSSPGVTKAVLEVVQAHGWKIRVYPFIHDGGLLAMRISS